MSDSPFPAAGGDTPLPPDPAFLEQRLSPEEQAGLQECLRDLGILLDELPEVAWAWTFWSAVAAVRLIPDLRERNPEWSETQTRTSAAHMLGLRESTLRARLNRLPGR